MPSDPTFRMTVEDVFDIRGRGTVATGRIESGAVSVGAEITIQRAAGGVKKTTVTGIESFRKALKQAAAGDNIGLLLKDDVQRGDVLTGGEMDFSWKP